jgi:hypothetical protein
MESSQYQLAVADAILRIGQLCEHIRTKQSSPNSTSSALRAPSPFSRRAQENLSVWIFQVESFFALKSISNLDRLTYMPSLLADHALLWFHNACVSIQENARPSFDSWQQFLDEFKQQFEPSNQQALLRRRLRQLQQQGPIQDYINKFRSILCLVTRWRKMIRYPTSSKAYSLAQKASYSTETHHLWKWQSTSHQLSFLPTTKGKTFLVKGFLLQALLRHHQWNLGMCLRNSANQSLRSIVRFTVPVAIAQTNAKRN